ncbi:hypothetical protein GGI21_000419 [Coemansia aciculifera]|nr:hypothetical protein GGI21_000419 [Coemansia aciculifera]
MDTTTTATVVLKKSQRAVQIECPASISAMCSLTQIQQFPPLVSWLQSLDHQMATATDSNSISISKLSIQGVDAFKSGKIGFLKFSTDAYHYDNNNNRKKSIPGIVFLRGSSVAVLVILRTTKSTKVLSSSHLDSDYMVMVEQPRVAVPSFALQELPAGMTDGDDAVGVSTAVREMLEETGITVTPGDLISLSEHPLYPSPGACDESVALYACEKHVSADEIESIRGRLGGLSDEHITVRLVRVCDVWKQATDLKALAALYLWDRHNNNNNQN